MKEGKSKATFFLGTTKTQETLKSTFLQNIHSRMCVCARWLRLCVCGCVWVCACRRVLRVCVGASVWAWCVGASARRCVGVGAAFFGRENLFSKFSSFPFILKTKKLGVEGEQIRSSKNTPTHPRTHTLTHHANTHNRTPAQTPTQPTRTHRHFFLEILTGFKSFKNKPKLSAVLFFSL